METIIILLVIVVVGTVVISNQNNNANRLRQEMVTPDQLEKALKSTKSSIKDSLNNKKQIYYVDSSEVTQTYINTLKAKHVVVYDQDNYEFIVNLAVRVYGQEHVCVDPVYENGNKFTPIAYQIYVRGV